MIVCVCRNVSDRDIAQAIRDGCETFDELLFELDIGSQCGLCYDYAKQIFEEQLNLNL